MPGFAHSMAMTEEVSREVAELLVARAQLPTQLNVTSALDDLRMVVEPSRRQSIVDRVSDGLTGYGPLSGLMACEPTDVLVNNQGVVWWDFGEGLVRADVEFSSPQEVRQLAVRLAVSAGKRLDDSQPFVDAQLADGVRLHATLPPLSDACAVISLRIPQRKQLSLDYWIGTARSEDRPLLARLLEERATLVVSGATGSGKTTFLRSLIASIAPRRVVTLEDTSELQVREPHVVSLQARLPNAEGRGLITVRDLVRQSLRMRPDCIVIGEVRGDEVLDWLLAVTSGHSGSATSVHAHSAEQALTRLSLLASLAGLGEEFARRLISESVDAVVHCERTSSGRRIAQVLEIAGQCV